MIGLSLGKDVERTQLFHQSIGLEGIVSVDGDAASAEVLAAAIDSHRPDILVNAVGVVRADETDRWAAGYAVNYTTAVATVDAIAATDPSASPFVIWVGSQAEYGEAQPPWTEKTREQPTTAYGASKHLATAMVLSAQRSGLIRGCVVRLPIVFGQGQAPTLLVASAIAAAVAGRTLQMTAGEQKRRFAYAPDVARVVVELGLRSRTESLPPLLNSPGYDPIEVLRVVEILQRLLPTKMLVDVGALDYRPGELPDAWPDTLLADSLGLATYTPIERALEETVRWYENNLWFVPASTP